MRKHLEKVQAELDAVQEFYTKKALAAQEREEFHTTNLDNYITANGLKKVATPYGTAFFRSHTRRTWPSDELTLIDFAKAEGVADECLQTKLLPKKAELLKYIHSTGAVPQGFLEEEVTDVQVRLRNEPAQEVV